MLLCRLRTQVIFELGRSVSRSRRRVSGGSADSVESVGCSGQPFPVSISVLQKFVVRVRRRREEENFSRSETDIYTPEFLTSVRVFFVGQDTALCPKMMLGITKKYALSLSLDTFFSLPTISLSMSYAHKERNV